MTQKIDELVEEYKLAFLHANGKEKFNNTEIFLGKINEGYLWVGGLPFAVEDIPRLIKKLLSKVKKD